MPDPTPHWLKHEPTQNFGDFLTGFLIDQLFERRPSPDMVLRVIGSCLSDDFVPSGLEDGQAVFWGCGARDAAGMSDAVRARVEILSVRGPLTRSALRLGQSVPLGDPGLLLPLLHRAARSHGPDAPALLVPHFHDRRSDDELLAASGCDAVLRPNLRNRPLAVTDFIEAILCARFVLAGSLHAAITAAAYGVPFAFWDSGLIDLPFKWRDFAASVQIDCDFHRRLDDAERWHAAHAAPKLVLPPLWPMLAVTPLPVRPALLVEALRQDIQRHGIGILDVFPAPRMPAVVQDDSAQLLEERLLYDALARQLEAAFPDDGVEPAAGEPDLRLRHDALIRIVARSGLAHRALIDAQPGQAAALASLQDELDRLRSDAEAAQAIDASDRQRTGLALQKSVVLLGRRRQELGLQQRRLQRQAAVIGQLQSGREPPGDAGDAAAQLDSVRQQLARLQAEHDAILRSTIWRAGRRLGGIAGRNPALSRRARQLLKLSWWVVSLRLADRLRRRRQLRQDIATLARSRLFDAAWYRDRYRSLVSPQTDPLLHYVWVGAAQGLDPHPLFDTRWYKAQLPPGFSGNPLAHYLTAVSPPDPHPLFDTAFYLQRIGGSLPRGQLSDGQTALEHCVAQGPAAESPNAVFEPLLYCTEYPDAASHPGGPLVHYVERGEAAGLAPHPLFDPAWYASRHPDRSGLGPLAHYLRHGRTHGVAGSATMEALGPDVVSFPFRLAYPAIDDPDVSIIVPAYGHLHETYRCLAAVMLQTGRVSYEVIVADDRPGAPVVPCLDADNLVAIVNPQNLGFLRSCNAAARHARGRMLLFLNNDTQVGPDWLRPMVALVQSDRRVGMVGSMLLNPDGTVQEAGGIIHSNGWGHPFGAGDDAASGACNYVREVDVVTGACFLVRRDLFDELGGFDDRYAPAFYEEFDLATALRDRGYKVLYQPASRVVHYGSASYGVETRDRQSLLNHAKFCAKWRTLLVTQPSPDDPMFLARERPSPRGVILVIDDKVPEYDKHAGAVTLFQYLTLMCELGLKVVFHPQDSEPLQPYTDALQRRGIEVLHRPDTLERWLARNGRHVDAIWTARPYVTFPILDLLKRHTGAPILYYTHDLHYLRELRRHQLDGNVWALEESHRLKPMELGIFAAVDRVMTPSAEEAIVIAAEVPAAHVTVVPPYLFDDVTFQADGLSFEDRSELIFVGGFDHTPNVDAALWLVRDIMPLVWRRRPDARVMIVGNQPPAEVRALAEARVEVTGFVPELAPYYDRARISISPLRYGAGVKGKIVGALQAGVPVITTGCGNEGIQLEDGIEALIADTAPGLADAVLRLLDDAPLCRSMVLAGAEVVRTRFSAARARRVLLGLLGDDLCPVCGTRPRQRRIASSGDRDDPVSCMVCLASRRVAALAQVLIAPYAAQRVSSLRETPILLQGLRLHALGSVGPISRELSALDGFTGSDRFDEIPAAASATLDLVISQGVMEHVPDPRHGWSELFRVLKPGGRAVFTLDDAADLPEMLRTLGFVVTRHDVGTGSEATGRVPVFEAVRPG